MGEAQFTLPVPDASSRIYRAHVGNVGWFAYRPDGVTPEPEPPPSPEELARHAAQRSVPSTGIRPVTEDISDDDLYEAFIEFLGCYGIAREITPDVIRVDIASDMYPTGRDPGFPLCVHLTRAQLRRLAWADYNVFDDTDPMVVPRTNDHVAVGFDMFTFYLEEDFESGVGDRAGVQPGHLMYDETVNDLRYRDETPDEAMEAW